jgi:hypothetical protein
MGSLTRLFQLSRVRQGTIHSRESRKSLLGLIGMKFGSREGLSRHCFASQNSGTRWSGQISGPPVRPKLRKEVHFWKRMKHFLLFDWIQKGTDFMKGRDMALEAVGKPRASYPVKP